jgi:hypothetical protein
MPKKILPGRKRQHKARDFVVHHLAETHPALALKLGRMPRFDPDRMSRRAALTQAADAVIAANPDAALCLYAEAIKLCAKGRVAATLQSLREKAGVARRRAQELAGQRRNQRGRALEKKRQERLALRRLNLAEGQDAGFAPGSAT